MNPWNVLDIEPTEEISTIKKAYAKKLKIHHPEDDPEGYQLLREAYDSALKLAKNRQINDIQIVSLVQDENVLSHEIPIQENRVEQYYYDEHNNYNLNKFNIEDEYIKIESDSEKYVKEFFEKVQALYDNFFLRIDEKNWVELLNSDVMWRIDCKDLINTTMLNFLSEHPFIPPKIWQLLNSNFQWGEQQEYLNLVYSESFIKYLNKQIDPDNFSFYNYFDKGITLNYDKYFRYREEAKQCLAEYSITRAVECINLAFNMYTNDPELLCIMGDYYLKTIDNKKADKWFKAAININPNDINIHFYIAQIMFKNKKYHDAIKVCNFIKDNSTNKIKINCFLGKRYLELKKLEKAKKLLLSNMKINPSDGETRIYLQQLINIHIEKLKNQPCNFLSSHSLIQIYRALDDEKNKMKIIRNSIKNIPRLLGKCLLMIFIIILVIGTKGSLLIIMLLLRAIIEPKKGWHL